MNITNERLLAIEIDASANLGHVHYWPDVVIDLVQEIRKLREELASHEGWKAISEVAQRELRSAQQEIDRLEHINDITAYREKKLIEGLRLYTSDYTCCPNCGMVKTDDGEEARDILKELGVTE